MFKRWFALSAMLFALWFAMSGKTEAKFIIAGLVSSGAIACISIPAMHIFNKGERFYLLDLNFFAFLKYCVWLLREIILSSLDVCEAILFTKKRVEPRIIRFKCNFINPMATVLLTNSIILTPGTVTVDVEDDIFVVHALTEKAANGLLEGEMIRRIAKLYDEKVEGKK